LPDRLMAGRSALNAEMQVQPLLWHPISLDIERRNIQLNALWCNWQHLAL
jgi:hypothetical protein